MKLLKNLPKNIESERLDAVPVGTLLNNSKGSVFNMSNRIKYQKGDLLNGLVYLNDVAPYISLKGQVKRKALFLCKCGKEFEALIGNVNKGDTSSCGCFQKNTIRKIQTVHGFTKYRLYDVYRAMIARCYNSNNSSYNNYGGRGITVYKLWKDDFLAYDKFISRLPNAFKKGYSIDRIENNKGYYPANVRWATKSIQSINKRYNNNHTGISKHKTLELYAAKITINNKKIWLGYHKTLKEAITVRNEYIIKHNLPNKQNK